MNPHDPPAFKSITVMQLLPALDGGGVERGTIEIAAALISAGHQAIVVSGGGRMVAELVALGAMHITLPIGKKSLTSLKYIAVLRHLMLTHQVDILHLRSRLPAWLGYLAWKKLDPVLRPRLVTTVHGPYTPNFYSAVMVKGERVIAVSDMIVAYIRQHYPAVPATSITRIYRGVDPALYAPDYQPDADWLSAWREAFPALAGKWVITLPGRITRWKGQLDLLAIVQRLVARNIPVHALIVGGAHPKKQHFLREIEARIAEMGLASAVTLTGQRSDLKNIMAISDVVLSLSTDAEAFGRVSLEALSLGKPVLGYAHGGVGEQLAAMYPAGAIALGDQVAAVETLAAWYCNGAPSVPPARPFTLARMQAQTLAVYAQLLAAPRSS
jgi:glycosyltransferase involved in cell wall biosynthesis